MRVAKSTARSKPASRSPAPSQSAVLQPMLGDATLVAFVATADLRRSHAFYSGVLGLRLLESSSFANVYEVNGTTLRVTLVEKPARAPYTVLGWRVPDINASIKALAARGVGFKRYEGMGQSVAGVWVAPSGSRIAWFEDPDANVLSLEEPPPA